MLPTESEISPKSRLVAALLCFFLGVFGAHRFYVGKMGTAILMIVTIGGFGIWALIDLVMIVIGSFTDVDGRRLWRWTEPGALSGETRPERTAAR
jgi:TM2 domain